MSVTNILATSVSIEEEQAQRIALKNRRGLLDRFALLFLKSSRGQESISSSKLLYYPLWLVGAEVMFLRPFSNPRVFYAFLGIDGYFGSVSQALGHPEAEEILVDGSQVVSCKVTKEDAEYICIRYLENTYGFRYKKVPEVKLMEIQQVYKPNFVFLCKKRSKIYFRAVDAESGVRNYVLDIRLKELSFLKDSRSTVEVHV